MEPQMHTDLHGSAQPQPKTSPQGPGAARIPGSARFQRANGDPTATTCTPEACAPRKTWEKFLFRRPRIWRLVVRRTQRLTEIQCLRIESSVSPVDVRKNLKDFS